MLLDMSKQCGASLVLRGALYAPSVYRNDAYAKYAAYTKWAVYAKYAAHAVEARLFAGRRRRMRQSVQLIIRQYAHLHV